MSVVFQFSFLTWTLIHLRVHDESDNEDDVDDGEGEEGVVEGGPHLRPHQDQDRSKVAEHTHHTNHRH